MMQTILFGALGLIFLAALMVWALPRGPETSPAPSVEQAPRSFSGFAIRLPEPQVTRKIFSDEDLPYVREAGGPAAEREYLDSRRRLSRLWLAEVRDTVRMLFRLYRTVVRHNVGLTLTVEVGVLRHYATFVLFAGAFDMLLRFLGPFRTMKLTQGAERQAERLVALLALPLANCPPSVLEKMEMEWRQQQAAG